MQSVRTEIKEYKRRKVRLQDVASKTGLAISTVSRVLNGQAKVKLSTEKRIYNALKELDYPFKSSLPSQGNFPTEHRLIAFLTPSSRQFEHETEVYELTAQTLRDVAEAHNYGMVVASYNGDRKNPAIGDKLILQKALAGAILFRSLPDEENYSEFSEAGVPFIVMNRVLEGTPYNYVGLDRHSMSEEMTLYLLSKGHRDIACLAYDGQNIITKEWIEGFKSGMKSTEKELNPDRIICIDEWKPDFNILAEKFFETSPLPSAILTCNDRLAWAVIESAKKRGLKVPDDLAVTGFGDWKKSENFDPPVTSIRVPWVDMFTIATKMLMEAIEHSSILKQIAVKVQAKLIIRESA